MGGNESRAFCYFPIGFRHPKKRKSHETYANPTQIRRKSYANPAQILCREPTQQRTDRQNERRGQRESAMKVMNTLTSELSAPVAPLSLRSATCQEVEKRVRLLEGRPSNPDQLPRLYSAAKLYVDSRGHFTTLGIGHFRLAPRPTPQG